MRAETPSEQLFFTTAYLSGRDSAGSSWTGTGFIVNYEVADSAIVPVLITNKHVLVGAVELVVRLVRAGTDGEPTSAATEATFVNFGTANWLGHPVTEVDVAVMFLAPALQLMQALGQPPFYRGFSPEQMLTEAQAQELDALEDVTFVGYPNGLFDTANFLPIARRGQTATPLQNNYRGEPAFLIDASVFGGSSGSPVFIFDRGSYSTRAGDTVIGSRFHLLGVLAAVHIRQTSGAIQDLPTKQIAVFDEGIDLGIVFKASTIQDCVDLLFVQNGIAQPARNVEALEGDSANPWSSAPPPDA